jgi:hypothetical protein
MTTTVGIIQKHSKPIKLVYFLTAAIVSFVLAANTFQIVMEDVPVSFSSLRFVASPNDVSLDSNGKISNVSTDCHCSCGGAFATMLALTKPIPEIVRNDSGAGAPLCTRACDQARTSWDKFRYTGRQFPQLDNLTLIANWGAMFWDLNDMLQQVQWATDLCRINYNVMCSLSSAPALRTDNYTEFLGMVVKEVCAPRDCYCTQKIRDSTRAQSYLSTAGGYFALFSLAATIIGKAIGIPLSMNQHPSQSVAPASKMFATM